MKKLKKAEMVRRGQVSMQDGCCLAGCIFRVSKTYPTYHCQRKTTAQSQSWHHTQHNTDALSQHSAAQSQQFLATQLNLICSIAAHLTRFALQIDHVRAERDVLAEVHNPYVVKLYYSFQASFSAKLNLFHAAGRLGVTTHHTLQRRCWVCEAQLLSHQASDIASCQFYMHHNL